MDLKSVITDDIQTLFNIFDNQIRLVGGCVRDYLLNKTNHDYDLATPLSPQNVIERLQQHHIPVFLTGVRYGTVTAVLNKVPYEITSLRTDTNPDGRHADVQFVADYQQDALRRDFTVNALYMDCQGHVSDYVDGLTDIKKKCVRFVGEPTQRVREDFLRILRYFRFVAYLGTTCLDESSLQACQIERNGLETISVERIQSEMHRLLMAPSVIDSLKLMHKTGVLSVLLPSYDIKRLSDFISLCPSVDFLQRLCVLTDNPLSLNWKWSRQQKARLQRYMLPVHITSDDNDNKYRLWQLGQDAFTFHVYQAVLKHNLPHQTMQRMLQWKIPVFPITGHDVYQLGFRQAEITRQLKIAEQLWVKMMLTSEKTLVINALLRYNEQKTNNEKDTKNAETSHGIRSKHG